MAIKIGIPEGYEETTATDTIIPEVMLQWDVDSLSWIGIARMYAGMKCHFVSSYVIKRSYAGLAKAITQVEDTLVVNGISAKGNDYRQALYDLVSFNLKIENDPAVSETAAKQHDLLRKLHTTLGELIHLTGVQLEKPADSV